MEQRDVSSRVGPYTVTSPAGRADIEYPAAPSHIHYVTGEGTVGLPEAPGESHGLPTARTAGASRHGDTAAVRSPTYCGAATGVEIEKLAAEGGVAAPTRAYKPLANTGTDGSASYRHPQATKRIREPRPGKERVKANTRRGKLVAYPAAVM